MLGGYSLSSTVPLSFLQQRERGSWQQTFLLHGTTAIAVRKNHPDAFLHWFTVLTIRVYYYSVFIIVDIVAFRAVM